LHAGETGPLIISCLLWTQTDGFNLNYWRIIASEYLADFSLYRSYNFKHICTGIYAL